MKINYKVLLLFIVIAIVYVFLQLKLPEYSIILTTCGGITGFILGWNLIDTDS